jgi:hypothetical protein
VRQRLALVFPKLPSFLDSWGYIFSAGSNDLVSTALHHNEFFLEADLINFDVPEALAPSFQSAWILETRFARDSYAGGFVMALNFRYEQLMQVVANAALMNDRSGFAEFEQNIGIEFGSISSGWLRAMQHLTDFGFFFEHLTVPGGDGSADALHLARRLKEICGWRMDFGRARSQQVFLVLVDSFPADLPEDIKPHVDLPSITSSLKGLLSTWHLASRQTS